MDTSANNENQDERRVTVSGGSVLLDAVLSGPTDAPGVVVFVYDRMAEQENILDSLATLAQANRQAGFATLTVNLLTPEDEALDKTTAFFRENIEVLHQRVIGITNWLIDSSDNDFQGISIGYFGVGVSAAAILAAAATRPDAIHAIVAVAPRTDLVSYSLPSVVSPTLFIAGEQDNAALDMSHQALPLLASDTTLDVVVAARNSGLPNTLETIPGVANVFADDSALQKVGQQAVQWFTKYLL